MTPSADTRTPFESALNDAQITFDKNLGAPSVLAIERAVKTFMQAFLSDAGVAVEVTREFLKARDDILSDRMSTALKNAMQRMMEK